MGDEAGTEARASRIWLAAGPLFFLAVLLFWRHDPMGVVVGLTVWMAIWWMTEAIPIPATSVLPMAILPLFAGSRFTLAKVSVHYGNWYVYLFFGGFLIAIAMEATGLHRRIALHLVRRIGTSPRRLLFGFMLATALLSMWISNTATTLMMLPIGLAVIDHLGDRPRFGTALMLGIAYAASIGGIGTLIGTPPNIAFRGQFQELFPGAPEVTFVRWMAIGLPVVVVFLPVCWLLLSRSVKPERGEGRDVIESEIARLGPMSKAERWVLAVFLLTALLWISRSPIRLGAFTLPGWSQVRFFRGVNDGVVAVFMGLLLFVLPARKGRKILDWPTVHKKMPWGILLLFGGGFALAGAVRDSGLSAEVGRQFGFLAGAPPLIVIAACAAAVTFLTEVTSNTATAQILLPLVGGIATGAARMDPRVMMLPVTISASCAFMLPVATPPNAVVFGSGRIPMRAMVRYGFLLNLIGIVIVTLICYFLGPVVFGIHYGAGAPAWASSG